jgi:long-chain fatty acid transport protein
MRHAIPLAALLSAGPAFAGGFDVPDNGTEALGRGGAFVAKADDGTALYYNPAGMARQEGTRLTIDANLVIHDMAFTRAGVYDDPVNGNTPYGGQPFVTIHDADRIFFAPFLAASTDLGGKLKRWRIGFGIFGPSSIGQHNYGVPPAAAGATDDPPATQVLASGLGAPAASRYDLTKTDLLIALPTIAGSFKPWKWIEFGFGWQIAIAQLDLASANVTNLGRSTCPVADFSGCDSYGRIRASGNSFASSSDTFTGTAGQFGFNVSRFGWIFSTLAHPTEWLDLGLTVRPQIDVFAEGKLHAVPPPAMPTALPDVPVTFATRLPTVVRVGGRAVKRYADGTERADVELDLVYENWAVEKSDHVHGENFPLGVGGQLDVDVLHNYHDTFGVRAGGAYNHRLGDRARLIGRLGAYIDTSASDNKDTRIDFDSFFKLGLTAGLGVKWRGLTLNVAYAFVWSPDRTVTDSEIRAVSATNGTNYGPTDPNVIIGNGLYQPMMHIVSFGLTVNFSELTRPTLMPN